MYKIQTTPLLLLALLLIIGLAACQPAGPVPVPTASPAPSRPVATITPSPAPRATITTTPTAPPPTNTPTKPACDPLTTRSGVVGAGMLDKPMDYLVLLPPCYEQQPELSYPVLYLFHGLKADQNQWVQLGIDQAAENLINTSQIPPFIIVLPYDYSFKQPNEYRFEEVFIDHLLPEIEASYRTITRPQARAIGGLSRGGAWAIYLASRHPEIFSIVGAHSPVVFYSNSGALPLRLRDIPLELRPVFYVDAGDRDIDFRKIQDFTALLNSFGYTHEWRYNFGYHNETYWSSHLEEYLLWYGRQFSAPD